MAETAIRILAAALALAAGAAPAAAAAEEVAICFNYGCKAQAVVRYSPFELGRVQSQFVAADSPAAERAAIARAVAWLYYDAGAQSPIWRDRGGNFDDDDTQPGRMDCIDHSTNTTAYLRLIERRGWLRFHVVGERAMRGRLLSEHWAARVVERGSDAEWVVDTWLLDPGFPAEVFPLEAWIDGAEPAGFRDRQHAAP
jgi:hypothetical protein